MLQIVFLTNVSISMSVPFTYKLSIGVRRFSLTWAEREQMFSHGRENEVVLQRLTFSDSCCDRARFLFSTCSLHQCFLPFTFSPVLLFLLHLRFSLDVFIFPFRFSFFCSVVLFSAFRVPIFLFFVRFFSVIFLILWNSILQFKKFLLKLLTQKHRFLKKFQLVQYIVSSNKIGLKDSVRERRNREIYYYCELLYLQFEL